MTTTKQIVEALLEYESALDDYGYKDEAARIRSLAASLQGMAVVPVEPTEKMVWQGAGVLADSDHGPTECYTTDATNCFRAMLRASDEQ